MSSDNVTEIRQALDNPAPAPQLAQEGDVPEKRKREVPPFPPGCPVTPLGMKSSIDGKQTCYYLDANGQLVGLEAGNRHGKNSLIALFGEHADWLEDNFPQWSKPIYDGRGNARHIVKPSEIIGFDQAEASQALIVECARRGIFTAAGKVRGLGAHAHNVTGLTLHCGDKVLTSKHRVDMTIKGWEWIEPGVHAGFVYPGSEIIPRPYEEEVGTAPARKLTKLLITWNWRRPLVDPRMLLGAIGASLVGGALRWRSNVWITGGTGTGKSTLNGQDGVIHQLFGEGLFRTGNASSAAIRQSLQNATVPVMIDEIEADEDNARKVKEVVELARISSSGDKMHRGGQDHQAHEFTLRSLFWFSSINIPPLKPQDRSRLAILELKPLPEGNVPPDLPSYKLPLMGRELMRRMVDGWHRLEATKLKYHAALAREGHAARACDQFGWLLACGDVLLHDWEEGDYDTAVDAPEDIERGLPPHSEVDRWAELCRPERMREVAQATADHEECLEHLLNSMVQARGGDERETIASWIGDAVAHAMAPLYAEPDAEHHTTRGERATKRLQELGLKLVNPVYHPDEHDARGQLTRGARWGAAAFESQLPGYLAVALSHTELGKLYQGKVWAGIWGNAMARIPGAIEGVKVKFGKRSLTAVLVPLHAVLDAEELPDASKPSATAEWYKATVEG